MKYGAFGNYWVTVGGTTVYNRRMCVMWTRDANGTLWPKGFEKGFETETEAWDYLAKNNRI